MPFDGAGFPRYDDRPPRPSRQGDVACVIIIVLAFSLLVLPISLDALVDIVHYMRGH